MNNHLFISQQGLRVMNVANPFNPQLIAQAPYPGSFAYQIAVQGNRAYMAKGGSGYFAVYNITNFNSPVLDGTLIIPATAFLLFGDMVPFGNYVYMTGHDTLYVINVSNVSSPQLANKIQVPPEAGVMDINENFLYVLTTSSIRIYDISVPQNPVFVNSISNRHTHHQGIEIDTAGDRLFSPWSSTLQEYHGHDAYNISNPMSPVYLFSDSTEFSNAEFGLTGYYRNILYINQSGRIKAFDVSPGNHRFLTSFLGENVANSSVSIEVKDTIFYNVRRSGVEILKFSGLKSLNIAALVQGFYNPSTNLMVPDTMTVYIRNSASPFAVIDSAKALINNAGLGLFTFTSSSINNNQQYYIQLKHRNSIETWSNLFSFVSNEATYSFLAAAGNAFGNNQIQVDNSPVRFAIYGGDVKQDGIIDGSDLSLIDNDVFNSITGYINTDLNGDNLVDGSDLSIADNNVFNSVMVIRP